MKSYSKHITTSVILASLCLPLVGHAAKTPDQTILPDDMQIYETKEYGVIHKAVKNATKKVLPTNNDYKGEPGCYLRCTSKNADYSVYSSNTNEYVKGQMRVKGHYADGHCIPVGYDEKDIQNDKVFQDLCEKNFPKQCVNGKCKINSETADMFEM